MSFYSDPKYHSNCFITTACIDYGKLDDDCEILNILRNYRDTYVLNLSNGNELVLDYYRIAPKIVIKINKDKHRATVLNLTYASIQKAVSEIQSNNNEKALCTYSDMVYSLAKRYEIS